MDGLASIHGVEGAILFRQRFRELREDFCEMVRLFVSNINFVADQQMLEKHFQDAGFDPLSVKIMNDPDTGGSRGFGFVDLETRPKAERAIELLHGKDFMRRRLNVSIARPVPGRRDQHRYGDGVTTPGRPANKYQDRRSRV